MARSLDQIVGELDSIYQPQIKSIESQKALVGQGVEADITQAKAEQGQAYEDILGGARRRGMGFSGIPLGEQAKYASTVFAPQVLRARQQGKQQELSLTDALNSIYADRRKYADTLRQGDIANDQWNQTFAFQKEQWAEQLRQQAADRAAAAKAAAASYGGGLAFGTPTTQSTQTNTGGNPPKVTQNQQRAFNEVKSMFDSNDPARIQREIAAIRQSASYGNQLDKIKLLFIAEQSGRQTVPASALGNKKGTLYF
jgi:GrpB-like predicted nucleotidyltransferase (UPF0157 family)